MIERQRLLSFFAAERCRADYAEHSTWNSDAPSTGALRNVYDPGLLVWLQAILSWSISSLWIYRILITIVVVIVVWRCG